MKGYYHSKETFGTVDGPGIRYVLFLAGCGLGCAFCHNPDTWGQGTQDIDSADVLKDVNEYRGFYETSGGGITVSGGEPLLQPKFVAELFRICKEDGISTTLDTAGYCNAGALRQVLPYTDHVLFSLKAASARLHKRLTLADSSEDILRNLRYIASRKSVTLRYVVIPGVSDTESEITQLIDLIRSIKARELKVDLLPYHVMGVYKWGNLGMEYRLEGISPASAENVSRVKEKLQRAGIFPAYTE